MFRRALPTRSLFSVSAEGLHWERAQGVESTSVVPMKEGPLVVIFIDGEGPATLAHNETANSHHLAVGWYVVTATSSGLRMKSANG